MKFTFFKININNQITKTVNYDKVYTSNYWAFLLYWPIQTTLSIIGPQPFQISNFISTFSLNNRK